MTAAAHPLALNAPSEDSNSIVALERKRLECRIENWTDDFRPASPLEHWLVGRAAVASLDVERLEQAEAEERRYQATRAHECWEADRQADAEDLAARLSKAPGKTVARLRATYHGALWLRERWNRLGAALYREGEGTGWSDAQRGLALDLLGVPLAERDGPTILDPPAGWKIDAATARKQIAGQQVESLTRAIDGPLARLDAGDRRRSRLGLALGPGSGPGSALAAIRRRIAASTRHMLWALNTLRKLRDEDAIPREDAPRLAERQTVETETKVEPNAATDPDTGTGTGTGTDYDLNDPADREAMQAELKALLIEFPDAATDPSLPPELAAVYASWLSTAAQSA